MARHDFPRRQPRQNASKSGETRGSFPGSIATSWRCARAIAPADLDVVRSSRPPGASISGRSQIARAASLTA